MAAPFDPLFVGLTRPAMLAGVTQTGVIINLACVAILFIMLNSFLYLSLAAPIHAIMWAICRWDAHFFEILSVWAQTTGRARFRNLWQGAVYRQ